MSGSPPPGTSRSRDARAVEDRPSAPTAIVEAANATADALAAALTAARSRRRRSAPRPAAPAPPPEPQDFERHQVKLRSASTSSGRSPTRACPRFGGFSPAVDDRAAPRRLDRGDVDLPHGHHRVERALCFVAAGRHRLGQHARRDLPGDAPFVLAPAARRFPGRHCRRSRSSSGRSLLVVGGDLEREGFVVLERGPAVEADAGDAGDGEVDRQHVARLAGRVVARERGGQRRPRCRERSRRRSGLQPRRPCRTTGRSCSWPSADPLRFEVDSRVSPPLLYQI